MKTRTISLVAGAAGAAWLMMASAGALAQEAGALVGPDPIAAVIDARERSKMLEKAPLVGGLGGMRGETNAPGSGAVRSASTLAAAPTRDSREGSALGGEPSASGGRGGIDTGSMSSLLSMALPLGGVIVLLFGCMVILKRVMGTSSSLAAALGPGGRAPGGVLEVLGRYPVAKGQLLVLIKIDRRVLLVGHSSPGRGTGGIGGGFSTLCEITDPEEVAAVLRKVEDGEGKSAGARFGSLLQRKSGVSGGERAGGRAGDDMELGVHEVASSRGRRVQRSEDGDVVEVWDETSAGAADLLAEIDDEARGDARGTRARGVSSGQPADGAYAVGAEFERGERTQRDEGGSEESMSFAQIRQRLNGLQGRGLGGVGGRGGVA